MKKIYLVKKNPSIDSKDNWIIMNGYDFATFLKTPQGVSRKDCFGKLLSCSEDDSVIIIECSAERAAEIDRENKKKTYKDRIAEEDNIELYSYSHHYNDDTEESGEDLLVDSETCVEDEAIALMRSKALKEAIRLLPDNERKLICALYSPYHPVTEAMYAKAQNTSRSSVNALKRKSLGHLKKFLENNPYFFTAF